MLEDGATLDHLNILMVVKLPPTFMPRNWLRGLIRSSEAGLTYWEWTTRESRAGHKLSDVCAFEGQEEKDYLPSNTHNPGREPLIYNHDDIWMTEEERDILLSQRAKVRLQLGGRLRAQERLKRLPFPTEREQHLMEL